MEPVYITLLVEETGKRIRDLMDQCGYSVKDIQTAMGFENPQAIYKWLSGESMPKLDNLLILSKVLHTKIDDIVVTKVQNSD